MGFEDTGTEEEKHFTKKVYVICEGVKTEPGYLDFFEFYHSRQNEEKKKAFEIEDIDKISFDTNNTNRKDMMRLLEGEMIMLSEGKHTPFFLITLVLRNYSELIGLNKYIADGQTLTGELFEKFKELAYQMGILMGNMVEDAGWFMTRAKDLIMDLDSFVDHDRLEKEIDSLRFSGKMPSNKLFGKLIRCYTDLYGDKVKNITERIRGIRSSLMKDCPAIIGINETESTDYDKEAVLDAIISHVERDCDYNQKYHNALRYNDVYIDKQKSSANTDRKFIIFDRDYDNFWTKEQKEKYQRTDKDYEEIISFCSDSSRNYEVLLSTPCFEFWLLMHHENANYKGIDRTTREIVYERLGKLEGFDYRDEKALKNIDKRYKDNYKDTFDYAVEQSKTFATDPRVLIKEIGSNVGIKLKSLLDE